MPYVNFPEIPDGDDREPLPNGKYLCRVDGVETKTTSKGAEMWTLSLRVASGPHKDRVIFDNVVFSEAAMKRVKLICSRLGIDTSQAVDLTPQHLDGKIAMVAVEQEDYQGRMVARVPFNGYERVDGDTVPADATAPDESDIPF